MPKFAGIVTSTIVTQSLVEIEAETKLQALSALRAYADTHPEKFDDGRIIANTLDTVIADSNILELDTPIDGVMQPIVDIIA